MDNLASHKVAGVKESIERAGATLRFLPAALRLKSMVKPRHKTILQTALPMKVWSGHRL